MSVNTLFVHCQSKMSKAYDKHHVADYITYPKEASAVHVVSIMVVHILEA